MAHDLLCLGLTTLDIVALPINALPEGEATILVDKIGLAPAGTAGGAALVAATLGLKVALASAVGDDQAGRFVRLALREAGVDITFLETRPDRPTSTTVLAVDAAGRRPNFHAPGAGMETSSGPEVRQAAEAARFVHYGGVGARSLDGGPGAAILAAARAAGAVVTCDLISPRRSAPDELKRLLPLVSYFMPSASEALSLTGCATIKAAADVFLDWGAGACIIKNGADGAVLAVGRERTTSPAFQIQAVDTTSCGDAYCAAFIAATSRGAPPEAACRFAAAAAALVAGGPATLGRLRSFDDTLAAMGRMTPREIGP
jgi:sugar/nucleoside kinase (ribokinase family)